MDPLTPLGYILATILIALLTGMIGKNMGGAGRISEKDCDKNRNACSRLIDQRLGRIEEDIKSIFKLINESLIPHIRDPRE